MLEMSSERPTGAVSPPQIIASDAYFSADVETDGAIPGPFSMLSFALVYAGSFDGETFKAPATCQEIYFELKPISDTYELEALRVNGIDRKKLCESGEDPAQAMSLAAEWVRRIAQSSRPVLVAYPLSFDWSWLYWYFVKFSVSGSPFSHSSCFDIKTAFAVKNRAPISASGRSQLLPELKSSLLHSHHALDDAREQAEIFRNVFDWEGR